ncbi:MAG: GntR family transcriptional regulator [Parabacteroides sp.]|nr:GntR family transcriptional regulator [Parabacteroides sp.]
METLRINTETTTLVDLVEDSLLKYIKEKNLKPGDRLLHEEELSEQLGVGRNVVREALSRLRSLGILDSRKRRGIVLQEPDIKKNLEKLINPQILSRDTIIDLLELRYTLELGIIPTLFNRITDEDIKDLESILAKEVILEGVRVSMEDELEFHSRMYTITGNQIIMDLQQMLIPMYWFIHDNYDEFEVFNRKIKQERLQASHKDILQSLKSRDKKDYEEVIKRHLMAYQLYIEEYRKQSY